ncbi:TonB-dependent receptor [Dyadobacter chenwenxiniae]|uniref:TonB-dependent receptor n=1 Tax=Dyadobacter chenwenxiniae TaxID=2906456 RepID=A0A9X1PRG0_9BACT|nr:carboxypeptidase-like regulatory domain-containing protein [Dyadobacter chenwenxiniae]MCF0064754.1 TonB-dependent receptor [Dyadobacter chenwenxiniae]UON84192.1 TonB-dependent receptor [Dyadobacter chenwenxiniae]
MKYFSLTFFSLLAMAGSAQTVTQNIRGTLSDADSKQPLTGATVLIAGSAPVKGVITDQSGRFLLEQIPLGRVTLELRLVGYEQRQVSNIVVDAGQEVVLELVMQEATTQLNEVVVTATENKGEAQNDMALLSGRSISQDETKRYAGGFNDPAMILSNFAGVTNNATGSNEVIVRGNSPKYVQWRLEGVEITNPNHFADQNSVGGGVSALNNNLLAKSDFYTGAFSAEYGDVLSGVYDVKLRNGNNQNFQSILGIGILGADVTVEGPFRKDYQGSFLANYRYSTIGLLSDIGLVNIEGGAPTFQDGAFNLSLPTKNAGSFSLFGLGGLSKVTLDNFNPGTAPIPGNQSALEGIRKDYEKRSFLMNAGLSHRLQLSKSGSLTTLLSFSGNGINEDIDQSDVIKIRDDAGQWQRDSLANKRLNYKSRLNNSAYRASVTYNNKLNARHRIEAGAKFVYNNFSYAQGFLNDTTGARQVLSDFDEGIATLRNFVSWKYRAGNRVTIVAGLHNMNVLYNHKSTLEPRLAIRWNAGNRGTFNAGYGLHSTMDRVHNYFVKVKQPNGSYTEPNRNLGLLKAHHFVAGYEYRLTENLRVKAEAYYQHLYNLPVENSDTSAYATINEGQDFRYVELVNKGKGRNYGIEVTIERFFDKNYYFLINSSLYQSKYTPLDGKERNTAYADNYLVNVLMGKEFPNLGRKNNKSISLNAKVFFGGGKKYIPLLRNGAGQVIANPESGTVWDYEKAYEGKIDDIYQVTFSASHKVNKRKTTHELFLNIDNITNRLSRISEYYDDTKPGSVGYFKQFGIFPNIMYRIYL